MTTVQKLYAEPFTNAISFPLGGIGTGSIGLAGNGRFVDWEIFNSPNKRSFNGFSHFAVKAEAEGQLLDARVLQGDYPPPYMGEPVRGGPLHSGYGFGPESHTMAGMPHFRRHTFAGFFPEAELRFEDEHFPGDVTLQAWNPLIPLNDFDSSLPCAMFELHFTNTFSKPVTYTAALTSSNPKGKNRVLHRYRLDNGMHALTLGNEQFGPDDLDAGNLTLATDADEVSYQEFWYRGGWCDNLEMFWRDFARAGKFVNRSYSIEEKPHPRHKDNGTLAAHLTLQPGESRKVRFLVTWHFPNVANRWNPEPDGKMTVWQNYYATKFVDSLAVARYAMTEWERLSKETRRFTHALSNSTLPPEVLEAISSNLAVLKSPTCLRLSDGSFYGFEGCIEDVGSCEGSCTHVWNYAYALPFLFPALERSMRDLDFIYNRRPSGEMAFRLMLPLGRESRGFRACVDGQMGNVIKAYRDWKLSGNSSWLRENWEAIKSSIEYAWSPENRDRWDANRDGVIEGRQHHTLDMELFGPNSWLNGFYLAALKAGAIMAEHLGESERSDDYLELFRKGKAWTDKHLFNGSYYTQQLDLKDRSILESFGNGKTMFGEGAVQAYWNSETGEIKYQIGHGCVIDQVVAQWHANLCGLGEIFDKEQTRSALQALYRHNFRANVRDTANTWRLFSLNDEGGLAICTWPEDAGRPAVPLPYASETMTGFEYQAACHLIQEGFIEEGLTIVRAIRNRYDGHKRNPWNEMECGSHYARSMASYSLLLAFSGFRFDLTEQRLGFQPVATTGTFRCFWSVDGAWGTIELGDTGGRLEVLYGGLPLRELQVPGTERVKQVTLAESACTWTAKEDSLHFGDTLALKEGSALEWGFAPSTQKVVRT